MSRLRRAVISSPDLEMLTFFLNLIIVKIVLILNCLRSSRNCYREGKVLAPASCGRARQNFVFAPGAIIGDSCFAPIKAGTHVAILRVTLYEMCAQPRVAIPDNVVGSIGATLAQ